MKNKQIFIFLRKRVFNMEENDLKFKDKSIREFLSEGKMNTQLHIILEDASIYTLSGLVKYYQENLTFIRIKNIGRSVNCLLTDIANEYINIYPEVFKKSSCDKLENLHKSDEYFDLIEVTICKLLKEGKIDARTYNVLKTAKIQNVYDIICYYVEHKRFDNLKNAGRRTNEYLVTIFKEYRNKIINNSEFYESEILKKDENKNIEINLNLMVEEFYLHEKLSIRVKNIIKNEYIKTVKNLLDHYEKYGNFLSFQNCGPKSNIELINLAQQLKKEIRDQEDALKYYTDDYLKFQNIVKNILNIHILSNEKIKKESSEKNIEVFNFIKYWSLEYLGKRDHEIYLMWNGYNEIEKRPTLQKIGDTLNLTRERVRQIVCGKIAKFDNLMIKFFNVNRGDNTVFKKYIDLDKDIIIIDHGFSDNINKTEDCNFRKEYIGIILTQIYEKMYFNFRINNYTGNQNTYLVKCDIINEFDLKQLIKYIYRKAKNNRDILPNIKYEIMRNVSDNDNEKVSRLIEIIKVILIEEYDLLV